MSIEVIVRESKQSTYAKLRFAPAVRHGDLVFCSGGVIPGALAEIKITARIP